MAKKPNLDADLLQSAKSKSERQMLTMGEARELVKEAMDCGEDTYYRNHYLVVKKFAVPLGPGSSTLRIQKSKIEEVIDILAGGPPYSMPNN